MQNVFEQAKKNSQTIDCDTSLIITGRFEPVHIGHISMIKSIRNMYPNNPILICILKVDRTIINTSRLNQITSEKMSAQNSPLPDFERLQLFNLILKNEDTLRNCHLMLRERPDINFEKSLSELPVNRCAVFSNPLRDLHERSKILNYLKLNERFIIFENSIDELELSGTKIREQLYAGNYDLSFLPAYLRKYFSEHCIRYFKT